MPDRAEELKAELRRRELQAELARRGGQASGPAGVARAPEGAAPAAPDSMMSRLGLGGRGIQGLEQDLPEHADRADRAERALDPTPDFGVMGRLAQNSFGAGLAPRAAAAVGAAFDPDATYEELLAYERKKIADAQAKAGDSPASAIFGTVMGAVADPANLVNPTLKGGAIVNTLRQGGAAAARGAVRGAAQAEPGNLEAQLKGAGTEALLEGGFAAVPAAVAGAAGKYGRRADEFGQIADKAGEGAEYAAAMETLPARRAARAETITQQDDAYRTARDKFRSDSDLHRAELARIQSTDDQATADWRQAVQDTKDSNARARFEHGEEVARLRKQAEAEALAESRRPTEDKAARIFGLEGKQSRFGGGVATDRLAKRLFGRQTPGGEAYLDKLLDEDPLRGMEWLRQQQARTGEELSRVRGIIADSGLARPAAEIREQFRAEFEDWPSEARATAIEHVNNLLAEASPGGVTTAEALRKLVTDVSRPGYQTGTLEAALGDRAKDVYRKAYKVLTDEEKGFVEHVAPEELEGYLETLAESRDLFDAIVGQDAKIKKFNQGRAPISWPRPQVVEPELPPAPAELLPPDRPAPSPRPAAPAAPLSPSAQGIRPPKVVAPQEPQGLAVVDDYLASTPEARAPAALGAVGAATGLRTLGGFSGAVLGRGLGRLAAKTLQDAASYRSFGRTAEGYQMAQQRALLSQRLAEKWARAGDALTQWGPYLSRAMTEGLEATLAAHQALENSDPNYQLVMEQLGSEPSGDSALGDIIE